jgi:hypothetical protein
VKKKKQQQQEAPAEGPPDDFCEWWNPSGIQQPSGASVGGHHDAERTWARKDEHGWTRRVYGINAAQAWLAMPYRAEYNAWVASGRPERNEDFVSLALPMPKQIAHWKQISATLSQIAKPVPKMRHKDLQREQLAASQRATLAEPLDETSGAIDFDKRENDE